MLVGIVGTGAYIIYFKFLGGVQADWLWAISPEGIGTLGMLLNFAVAIPVALMTAPPPKHIMELVEDIRMPAE